MTLRSILPAVLAGLLFGAGLTISDMVNPARVLAFLDVFGHWDPTLAFVLGGAVLPSALGYRLVRGLDRPLLAGSFKIPASAVLDRRLIAGAALFGVGWGLVGLCPGPAIAGLVFGKWQLWLFVAAMLAGMLVHRFLTGIVAARHAGSQA